MKKYTYTKIETTEDMLKLMNRHGSGPKDSGGFIQTVFFIISLVGSLYYFSSLEPKTAKESIADIVKKEKTLRQIVVSAEQNADDNTNVELYQTELNHLKKEVEELRKEKSELSSNIENKQSLIKNEMLLKGDIKETELSMANGEGYSQGYEDGLRKGRNQDSGEFGVGIIMGGLIFGK